MPLNLHETTSILVSVVSSLRNVYIFTYFKIAYIPTNLLVLLFLGVFFAVSLDEKRHKVLLSKYQKYKTVIVW